VPSGGERGRLHEEIEDLFADLWHVPRFAGMRRGFRPSVDCFRTDEPPELTILVELAGVSSASIELFAVDRQLVVSGERQRPRPDQRPSYYQMEIEYGPFERRIPLPEDADTSTATAKSHDGLLTIVLPLLSRPPRRERVSIPLRTAP
jgi:HSP20 family protein